MLEHPAVMILGAWGVIALVLLGVGLLVRRAFRFVAVAGDEDGSSTFWLGWVTAIAVLQIWHLALPIDRRASAAIVVASLLGYALGGVAPWKALGRGLRSSWPVLPALVPIAAWLADRAVDVKGNGDSGLYHWPTIRWLLAYPIVPGLGNLHARFAFNQSYFLYVSALEIGPFVGRTGFIANGVLVLAYGARALLGAYRLLRWTPPRAPDDLFYALTLPAVAALGYDVNVANPSPDLPLYVFALVLSGQLVALSCPREARPSRDFDLLTLAAFALIGVTIKLSFGGAAGAALAVALIVWWMRERPPLRRLLRTAAAVTAIGAASVVPWMIRGVIVSGYPLFPALAFPMPVAWRIPEATVIELNKPVLFWELMHMPWWKSFDDLPWLTRSLEANGWVPRDLRLLEVALGALAIATLVGLVRVLRRKAQQDQVTPLAVLPAFASLLFVYATAPFARYAGASLWAMAAVSLVLALEGIVCRLRGPSSILLAAGALWLAAIAVHGPDMALRKMKEFPVLGSPRITARKLATGLEVQDASLTSSCWNAPLPCTPTPDETLKLRRAGELGSGFVLDPTFAPGPRVDP